MSTEENSTSTILELFQKYKLFKIPQYQRPYSWEEKQLKQFIEDLNEFSDRGNYYLGHFLLEKESDMGRYAILDGQQRLTTMCLFFRACYNITKNKDLESKYLINENGKIVLEAIDSDSSFFDKVMSIGIIEETIIDTPSKKRLKEAYNYFMKEVKNLTNIEKIIDLIENSTISINEIENREIANQVFLFHNARGKSLTNLDKLKSFLTKKIYDKSKDNEVNKNIKYLDSRYSDIFSMIYSIDNFHFKKEEDEILFYFFVIFYNHDVKKALKIEEKEDLLNKILCKAEDISAFSEDLSKFYCNFKNMLEEVQQNNQLANILYLNNTASTYCILMALYEYNKLELTMEEVKKSYKMIEITYFRMKFADFGINSNYFAKDSYKIYNEKLNKEDFFKSLEDYMNNSFKSYKIENRLLNNYNKNFYNDKDYNFYANTKEGSKYLLWKYNNYLLLKSNHKREEFISLKELDSDKNFETIEHIYPQSDNDINDRIEDNQRYIINDIGNLLPLKKYQNSSKGKKSPEDKYIIDFISKSPEEKSKANITFFSSLAICENVKNDIRANTPWRYEAIKNRGKSLREFAKEYFDKDYIEVL